MLLVIRSSMGMDERISMILRNSHIDGQQEEVNNLIINTNTRDAPSLVDKLPNIRIGGKLGLAVIHVETFSCSVT